MNKTISLVLVVAFIIGLSPGIADARFVTCVGSSTTYGYGLPDRVSNCYPAQLARILQGFDSEWETRNFGVNGTCVLRKGSKPYITQSAFHDVLASEPDVVVIQLGVNDSIPNNWRYKDDFIPDFLALIDAFAQLPSQPKIYIWYPKPVFSSPWDHDNVVIRDEIIPLISQLPTYRDVQVIDLYTPLKDSPQRACISRAGSILGLQRWQEQELTRLEQRQALMRVSRHPDPIHLLVKDLNDA